MNEDDGKCDVKLLLTTSTKVDLLSDRFDNHMKETRDELRLVRFSIDELKDALTSTRIDTIEKTGTTNAKIAGISGAMAIIMHFISSFLSDIIKK